MSQTTPPPPGASAQRVQDVRAAKNAYLGMMMEKANVTAVGIGYKNRGRTLNPELAIVVSVEQKLPLNELREIDRLPRAVDSVPVDVVESGPFFAFAQTERLRPARPGISIGNVQITAGTFGCVVSRGGTRFVLSNNHVLADANKAPLGSVVVQPGVADGGTNPADRIGTLAEFVPIAFDGEAPPEPPTGCAALVARFLSGGDQAAQPFNEPGRNKVDCALCVPDNPAQISTDILGIGTPVGTAIGTLGLAIQKSGRTTGLTQGEIEQIDVVSRVNFGGPVATFTGQLLAGAMSQPGDSGSAVLDQAGNVVGLLFAGSNVSTLINPIQDVLTALRVQLVTTP